MTVATIIALVLAVPVILFPAVFVWYINIGGMLAAVKEARERQTAGGTRRRHPQRYPRHRCLLRELD